MADKLEPEIDNIPLKKIKISARSRCSKENIAIISMLSEFGCETIGILYCVPELLRRRLAGKYTIALTWEGRSFLYKHLVDEVWEIDSRLQFLRKYCKAFHHDSKNLKKLEKELSKEGMFIGSSELSNMCVYPKIHKCECGGKIISMDSQICILCGKEYPMEGFFNNPLESRKKVKWISSISENALDNVKDFIGENTVGICARNRVTYDRNLDINFYKKLIVELEDQGYDITWFGEKISTHECPFSRVKNFRDSELSNNLENTLALISKMKFTIQCYTASTRLSALVGTSYILVESPGQLWSEGQEGIRLNMISRNNKNKIIASNFKTSYENNDYLLSLIKRGIEELNMENYSDIIADNGQNKKIAIISKKQSYDRIGEAWKMLENS